MPNSRLLGLILVPVVLNLLPTPGALFQMTGPALDRPLLRAQALAEPPIAFRQIVKFNVAYLRNTVREQIRRRRISGSPHQAERVGLAEHLASGPTGLWIHSHLVPFPSGHGTLLEVRRNSAGLWEPLSVLLEQAIEKRSDIGGYFFALDTLTRSRHKRERILSTARPFVDMFQGILERARTHHDIPITQAMGRGITPGTEDTWVMEETSDWDAETGLWFDERSGWMFLRADLPRENVGPAEEAVFILRQWAKRLDLNVIEFGNVNFPDVPARIDRQTLPRLLPWVQSLSFRRITRGRSPYEHEHTSITAEEVAYLTFLIEKSQQYGTAIADPVFGGVPSLLQPYSSKRVPQQIAPFSKAA